MSAFINGKGRGRVAPSLARAQKLGIRHSSRVRWSRSNSFNYAVRATVVLVVIIIANAFISFTIILSQIDFGYISSRNNNNSSSSLRSSVYNYGASSTTTNNNIAKNSTAKNSTAKMEQDILLPPPEYAVSVDDTLNASDTSTSNTTVKIGNSSDANELAKVDNETEVQLAQVTENKTIH